jgi:hypothetical protein
MKLLEKKNKVFRNGLATKNLSLRKENLTKTCPPLHTGLDLGATRSVLSNPATLGIPVTTNPH